MKKKLLLMILIGLMSSFLTGCDVQIFESDPITEAQYESSKNMSLDTYYVKNGTKFSEVYMPSGNISGIAKYVSGGRVLFFYGDEPMVPEHYSGEIIAYRSKEADLESVSLERFKDMGYSLGIYGGSLEDDGYYHIDREDNVCPECDAAEQFSHLLSDEIRIISIGGVPIANVVDEESGIITGLSADLPYTVELYSGTSYYAIYINADMHFLRAMELYNYDTNFIQDTQNGYMCFNTPTSLKSGYYLVNGSGLFLYHDYAKGSLVEDESLNEPGFDTEAEALASYSQEFKISIPSDTKNVNIIAYADEDIDDAEAIGKVIAPNGTVYTMTSDLDKGILTLNLSLAKAGEWEVFIPQCIEVSDVEVEGSEIAEATTCYEEVYTIEEDTTFKRFYIPVYGDGAVYGNIIREGDNRTFSLIENTVKKENGDGKQRYLSLEIPYLEAGKYTLQVYYYASSTEVGPCEVTDYVNSDSDILVIEGDYE